MWCGFSDSGRGYLDTELIPQAAISPQAARSFGAALALTHAGGADWYGQPPLGFSGPGFMGRSSLDLIYEDDGQNWGRVFRGSPDYAESATCPC